MRKMRIMLCVRAGIIFVQGYVVQAQEAKARGDMTNLIRKEKIEIILPQSMRDNNIDMRGFSLLGSRSTDCPWASSFLWQTQNYVSEVVH